MKILMFLILLLPSIIYGQSFNSLGQVIVNPDIKSFKISCIADSFCFPVNHGSMKGYENAFTFQQNSNYMQGKHQAVDISKIGGGDNDLGDTIYCIANGRVVCSFNDVIMVLHKTSEGFIVSLYRHCMELFVRDREYVSMVQPIGRIGNCNGVYLAHLHFEIRTDITIGIGTGYGKPDGFVHPLKYITFKRKEKYIPF